MIRLFSDELGLLVTTKDGSLGTVVDLHFDDRTWALTALVTEIDNGMGRKPLQVAVSSFAVRGSELGIFPLTRTRSEVLADADRVWEWPVSARRTNLAAQSIAAQPFSGSPAMAPELSSSEPGHVRSCRHLRGYSIVSPQRKLGRIEDFLIDESTKVIRQLLVVRGHLWSRTRELVSTQIVDRVVWSEARVYLNSDRTSVVELG